MPPSKAGSPGAQEKKILTAMAQMGAPQAPKQIAVSAGLDSQAVSQAIKTLKAQGLVHSPIRCKYALTDAGTKSLKG